jgi:hypothetical protein
MCHNANMPGVIQLVYWVLLFSSVALALVVGVIVAYHWFRYAMNPVAAFIAIGTYSIGALVLLAIMLGISLIS